MDDRHFEQHHNFWKEKTKTLQETSARNSKSRTDGRTDGRMNIHLLLFHPGLETLSKETRTHPASEREESSRAIEGERERESTRERERAFVCNWGRIVRVIAEGKTRGGSVREQACNGGHGSYSSSPSSDCCRFGFRGYLSDFSGQQTLSSGFSLLLRSF
jgi:hypothetical protein